MKHFPPLHGDRAPRMKHFSPLHGMDRAIMKFLSPTHTQNDQFPTIFSVLGRYFFHRGTQTTMRCYAGAIFLSCNPWKHPGVADTGGTEHTSRRRAWPRSRKVTAEPGRTTSRRTEHTSATRHHWCGGRRRVRRARAGFEIDPSEPQARVWRSRGRPGPTAPGTPAVPHSDNMQRQRRAGGPPPTGTHSGRAPQSSPAQQVRPSGARNTSGAASTAGNQAISGSRAPSGSPTRRQHPSARAGAPNRRLPAHGPRPRR